jgi:hypothetical protein
MLIQAVDSPSKAGMILAFETRRQEKIKQKDAEKAHEYALAQQKAKTQGEMAIIDQKGKWDVEGKNVEGEWYYKAHKETADASIKKKQMDLEGAENKVENKKEADIETETHKKNLEHQSPL